MARHKKVQDRPFPEGNAQAVPQAPSGPAMSEQPVDELEPGGDPDAVPDLDATPPEQIEPDQGDAGRPHV